MRTTSRIRFRLHGLGRQTWLRGTPGHETWGTPHALTHPEFWIFWGGVGEISGPGFSRRLSQGTVALLPSGTTFSVKQNPKAPLSVNFFEISCARLPKDSAFLDLPDVSLYESISRRVLDLHWEVFAAAGWQAGPRSPRVKFTRESSHVRTGTFCPNPIRMWSPSQAASVPPLRVANGLLKALLDDFLLRLRDGLQRKPRVLGLERRQRDSMAQIASDMRNNPGGTPSLVELAREAGYSPDHFARIFHKVHGTSPKLFLITARADRAKCLLATSSLTIKEIADHLGYSSPFFFSRQFKEITGSSPSDFRRKSLGKDH